MDLIKALPLIGVLAAFGCGLGYVVTTAVLTIHYSRTVDEALAEFGDDDE